MDASTPPCPPPTRGWSSSVENFMEREAGHVAVSLLLIVAGAVLWRLEVPKAEDLILFATGVLARSMVGKQSNLP
jgi:hypothetical protein